MKNTKYFFLLLFGLFAGFALPANAQECPPPESLKIIINETAPPSATISWAPPAGVVVEGYLFTYTIDGQPPQSVLLPPNPTTYTVPLPENWQYIEVSLQTVCEGGYTSSSATARKTSIILVDLIMVRFSGTPEEALCAGYCPDATHFGYGFGGIVPPNSVIYKKAPFCNCMSSLGNDFGDPTLVQYCKDRSKELFSPSLSSLAFCNQGDPGRSARRHEESAGELLIQPNPAGRFIKISGFDFGADEGLFNLFDLSGVKVKSLNIDGGEHIVELDNIASGLYFYQIETLAGVRFFGKIVKNE